MRIHTEADVLARLTLLSTTTYGLRKRHSVLARATPAEMAGMVDYLKTENRILRSKLPKRVNVTPAEREQLVKRGKPLGKKIKQLITIVSPRTFARWASGETKSVGKRKAKVGRPRKPEEVRQLVVTDGQGKRLGAGPDPRRAEEAGPQDLQRHGPEHPAGERL